MIYHFNCRTFQAGLQCRLNKQDLKTALHVLFVVFFYGTGQITVLHAWLPDGVIPIMPQQGRPKEVTWTGKQELGFADTDVLNVNVNNEENQFDSLVILEFSLKVPPPAIQWILDKIKLLKSKGGSELLICPIVDENHEVCVILMLLQSIGGSIYSLKISIFLTQNIGDIDIDILYYSSLWPTHIFHYRQQVRDRPKFGFSCGFGAETDLKCSFGNGFNTPISHSVSAVTIRQPTETGRKWIAIGRTFTSGFGYGRN